MATLTEVSAVVKYLTGALTLVIGIGVIVVCSLEWRYWKAGSTMIDKSQLGLRLGGGGLLLVILGMIFFGVFFAEMISERQVFLSFWTVCMALAIMLFLIAVIDLRKLAHRQKNREKELVNEFASVIRAAVTKKVGGEPPPDGPDRAAPNGN
ncbi:MAG: hypothetical protein AUJ92_02665 [Armatimonadetes bacterium CG2_30_59_28]|nr:hypothetical protein [Armatimonadota bacterium]OIO97909.1 MAG: hypothetical protein AUJ92_02665 [Armatimonadetes bacterium CG2_30_59_28]PIU65972.1 MAG: hypothetical protein COS85_06755 [Armatimonadetes bacterium CG07_land_8_20_14_0_80_59_28]PIX38545.1 MAG: hypothetical protein COZ56_20180 [Armatimonadetes bacterium CG_4_8_14_3_um_filter_58_9]PJB76380.1 MAG: hypothetical protein CO095_02645 [Armatimonadetes bacterium CG_4_9_14_3_um_filter_58_7]